MTDSSKNKQQNQEKSGAKDQNQPDGGYTLAVRALKTLEEAGYEARLAGGCVRDRLLGIRPNDYDIATKANPDQICLIFKQKNIKVVPTGIDHGTITVVIAGLGIEVTTLRRDVSTDGRRATVAFSSSFEEDAERRDFTFNAMYEDREGRIYDYFGGREDLQLGRLRFVGQAESRIREDYLRILRLFRFWARFGFAPDAATLKACQDEAAGMKIVSQERITHELLLTLEGDFVGPALEAMDRTGILQLTLGVSSIKALIPTLDALKIGKKAERSAVRMALLLQKNWQKDQKATLKAMQDLRLAKNYQQILLLHLEQNWELWDSAPLAIMERIDQWEVHGGSFLENILPLWQVLFEKQKTKLVQLEQVETQFGHRRKAKLPLDGQVLIAKCGAVAGPELGHLLLELKRSWRLGQWNTQEEGVQFALKLLGHH